MKLRTDNSKNSSFFVYMGSRHSCASEIFCEKIHETFGDEQMECYRYLAVIRLNLCISVSVSMFQIPILRFLDVSCYSFLFALWELDFSVLKVHSMR
jgi:hypothetical protein